MREMVGGEKRESQPKERERERERGWGFMEKYQRGRDRGGVCHGERKEEEERMGIHFFFCFTLPVF